MSDLELADVWPLTPLQEGLLFHARYDRQGPDVYAVQFVWRLDGDLDGDLLAASAEALLARHSNLRAGFLQLKSGDSVQGIPVHVDTPWRTVDLSGQGEDEATAAAELVATEERERRFDLAVPPLLRFALVRLAPERHHLVLTHHHILLDGWSRPVLAQELLTIYAAGGDTSGLPPVTPYREYLAWLSRQDRRAAEDAWTESLAGLGEPVLVAPGGAGRAALMPEEAVAGVGETVTATLREAARRRDLTLNTIVQGAWALLVGQLTGREDVVFGVTAAGRPPELPGAETMLGLFINTVPARARLDPRAPVADLLTGLQERQSALIEHRHLSLAAIQRLAGLGELFDTLLVYENYPLDPARRPASETGGLRVGLEAATDAAHYPLTLVVFPGEELRLRLVHRPDLFDAATAELIMARFVRILERIAEDPDRRLARLELLEAGERRRVLREWNDTAREIPDTTLAGLFESRVRRSPDAVAVVCEDESVSYGELNAAANRLAWDLIGSGVGPEHVVAVRTPRSIALVTALLAVAKTGAAYLPVDGEHPAARIEFMLADSGATTVLSGADPVEENTGDPPGAARRGRIRRT